MIKSKRLRWVGYAIRMEQSRKTFKILTGKPTGEIPLGRPGHICNTNIGVVLK